MSRPNLPRRASGNCILTICSATACAAAFSLVQIMIDNVAKIQLCLHDEAQQFGNLDEVAALARLPGRVVFSDCGCHLLRHALVCMTAYHLLVVIGLFA